MAKALTLWLIGKLERSLSESPESCKSKLEKVINELRIILDFLGNKKLENGSRLSYYISDIVDMVREALNIKDDMTIYEKILPLERWVKEVKTRVLKFGVEMKPDRAGAEGDDDDGEDVVGLEKDVEQVLNRAIFSDEKGLQTSIFEGVVGIGKTALARQVYGHGAVVDGFERRAWLCVSGGLSHREVLIKLIQQVVDCDESLLKKMEHADNRSLKQMLHQHLQGMRYFIVLDDWPEEMWLRAIFKGLPSEDKGSRLLVTKRIYYMEEWPYYYHEMKYLDSDKSWQLFLKTISGNKFTNEHKFPKKLEEKGREMVTKCGGLPLAIKHIGRQLAEKRHSGSEWEELLQSQTIETRKADKNKVATSMAEALILYMIGKLERSLSELPDSCKSKLEEVINEIITILDLLGDNKLENRSYYISDIADMVREVTNKDDLAMDAKILRLERWVKEVKKRMLKFGVEMRSDIVGVEGDDDDEEDVVQLGNDAGLLLSRAIFNEEKGLWASTIRGMVGIGKTTLARQVYGHGAVVDGFERRAWVCVSSGISHKEVLIKLIQQVVDCDDLERNSLVKKMEFADNRSLKQMLNQHLQGMRYFIVLDDWPEEMCLRSILNGLPHEDKGSRLLVTGRFHYLEAPIHYHHEMKYLDSNQSWKLFSATIFGGNKFTSEQKFPKYLESRGKELLAECGGLPLAITHVGRQLAEKRQSGIGWEVLLESIDLSAILDILESIYRKLDPLAKSCFLHLAFFKEKTTIRKQKLMQLLWAARGMSSLEIANMDSHLRQLIKESIVEVHDYPMKKFRVNALLHKLSNKKAEEELGFEMVRKNGSNRPSQSPRHRAIYCSRDEFSYSTKQDKHLVSLFFRGGGYLDASPSYWNSFELLEILDLEDFGIKILPESIDTLIDLRYLGLRNNYIKELPHTLGRLKKLAVLDIALNLMVEMPDIIWKLVSLRHLYMSNVICPKNIRIDALTNLETLTYVSVENWRYELPRLRRMTKLRNLGIEEVDRNSNISQLFASLSKIKCLENLTLKGFHFKCMPSLDELGVLRRLHTLKLDGRLAGLPCANNFPQYICSLKFVNSCLDEDPMPVLEKLPKLKYLKLRNAYNGKQMVITHNGFRELKVVCIEESWNLRNVQIGEGAMPRLEIWEIKNCPCLETLPEEIGSIASLEELKMLTTKKVATKIRKLGLISKVGVVDINP